MPLKLITAGGGSVILDANSTASTFTVNVPAQGGAMLTTGSLTGINASAISTGSIPTTNLPTIPTNKLPSGTVLQVQSATMSNNVYYSTTSMVQWPIGVTITPTSATSKILLRFIGWTQPMSELYNQVYIYRDGSNISSMKSSGTTGSSQGSLTGGVVGHSTGSNNYNNQGRAVVFEGIDSPGTTSAVSYTIRAQAGSSSYMNYYLGYNTSAWGQTGILTLTAMEISV